MPSVSSYLATSSITTANHPLSKRPLLRQVQKRMIVHIPKEEQEKINEEEKVKLVNNMAQQAQTIHSAVLRKSASGQFGYECNGNKTLTTIDLEKKGQKAEGEVKKTDSETKRAVSESKEAAAEEKKRGEEIGSRALSTVTLNPLFAPSIKPLPPKKNFLFFLLPLIQKWNLHLIPLINLLWVFVIVPLIALYRYVRQEHVMRQEMIQKEMTQWKATRQRGSPESTLVALEESINFLEEATHPLSEREKELLAQLKMSLNIGNEIKKRIGNSRDLRNLADNYQERIFSHKDSSFCMMIPCGYWRDGLYYSMMLSFFRDKEGILCMEKLTNDPKANENCARERVFYQFTDPAFKDKPYIADLLETLWLFQKKPGETTSYPRSFAIIPEVIQFVKRLTNDTEIGEFVDTGIELLDPTQEGIQIKVDQLFALCGASLVTKESEEKQEKEEKEVKATASSSSSSPPSPPLPPPERLLLENPIPQNYCRDLLQPFISLYFQETALSDKFLYRLWQFASHFNTIAARIDYFSPKEKVEYLSDIEKEIKAFKRFIDRSFGEEESFNLLVQQDSFFKELNKKILHIEKHIAKEDKRKEKLTIRECTRDLNRSLSTDLQCSLEPLPPSPTLSKQAARRADPTHTYQQVPTLEKLKEAIEATSKPLKPSLAIKNSQEELKYRREKAKEAQEHFSKLLEAATKLLEQKDWDQAQFFASMALRALPVPSHSKKCLWDISMGDNWQETFDNNDYWSKHVTQMAHVLWTAVFRSCRYMKRVQRTCLFKTRAILEQIAFNKQELVLREARKRVLVLQTNPSNTVWLQKKEAINKERGWTGLEPEFCALSDDEFEQFLKYKKFLDNPKSLKNINLISMAQLSKVCKETEIPYEYALALTYNPELTDRGDTFLRCMNVRALPGVESIDEQEMFDINSFLKRAKTNGALLLLQHDSADDFVENVYHIYRIYFDQVPIHTYAKDDNERETQKELRINAQITAFRSMQRGEVSVEKDGPVKKIAFSCIQKILLAYAKRAKKKQVEEAIRKLQFFEKQYEMTKEEREKKTKESVPLLAEYIKKEKEKEEEINQQKALLEQQRQLSSQLLTNLCEANWRKTSEIVSKIDEVNTEKQKTYQKLQALDEQYKTAKEEREKKERDLLKECIEKDEKSKYQFEEQKRLLDRLSKELAGLLEKKEEAEENKGEQAKKPVNKDQVLKFEATLQDIRQLNAMMETLKYDIPRLTAKVSASIIGAANMALRGISLKSQILQETTTEEEQLEWVKRQRRKEIDDAIEDLPNLVIRAIAEWNGISKRKGWGGIMTMIHIGSSPNSNDGILLSDDVVSTGIKFLAGRNVDLSLGPERPNVGKLVREKRLYPTISPRHPYTETMVMQEALEEEDNLNENYALSAMVTHPRLIPSWEKGSYSFAPMHALDILSFHPDWLWNDETQREVEISLFKTSDLHKLLKKDPEAILARIPIIKENILKALRANNQEIAFFLMHVSSLLKEHVESISQLSESGEKEKKEKEEKEEKCNSEKSWQLGIMPRPAKIVKTLIELEREIPSFDSMYPSENDEASGYKLLSKQMDKPPQKQLITYFLYYFYQKYRKGIDFSTMDPEEIAKICYAYSILCNFRTEQGLPFLQFSVEQWIRYLFLPALVKNYPSASMQKVLKVLCLKIKGETVLQRWEEREPLKFFADSTVIDLAAGVITSDGDTVFGPSMSLPDNIRNNDLFQKLFGNSVTEARCSLGKTEEDAHYQFEINHISFEIRHNYKTKKIELYRKQGKEWYQFRKVRFKKELKSGSNLLVKHGVWKSTQSQKAFSVFATPLLETGQDIFTVELTLFGNIKSVYKKDPKTGAKLILCQDPHNYYAKWFRSVASEQVVILRRSSSAKPCQIHLLEQQVVLTRMGPNKWVVTTGKHIGYEWYHGMDADLLNSNRTAQAFLDSLGEETWRSCLLPLHSKKEFRMIIQPHLLEPIQHPELREPAPLGFIRESYEGAPLEISFSSQGKIESSCPSFLFLALIFSEKGDTKRAYHYMQLAAETQLKSEELLQFKRIAAHLRTRPRKTMHQMAFQLKAELLISKILRQQTTEVSYTDSTREEHLTRSFHICQLYKLYEARMQAGHKSNPSILINPDLVLSSEDERELRRVRLETLEEFFSSALPSPLGAPPVLKHDHLEVDIDNPIAKRALLLGLTAWMADPSKPIPADKSLSHISEVSDENILTYFWLYCKEITEKNLSPQLIRNLYISYRRAVNPKIKDPAYHLLIIWAWDALIQLAEAHHEGKTKIFARKSFWNNPKALQNLYKKKQSLPTSFKIPQGCFCLLAIRSLVCFIKYRNAEAVFDAASEGFSDLSTLFTSLSPFSFPRAAQTFASAHSFSPKSILRHPRLFEVLIQRIEDAVIQGLLPVDLLLPLSNQETMRVLKKQLETQLRDPKLLSKVFSNGRINGKFVLGEIEKLGFPLGRNLQLRALRESIAEKERLLKKQEEPIYTEIALEKRAICDGYRHFFIECGDKTKEDSARVVPSLSSSSPSSPSESSTTSKWGEFAKDLMEVCSKGDLSPMERHENREIDKGLTKAQADLEKQFKEKWTLHIDNIEYFSLYVDSRIEKLAKEANEKRKKILEWAASNKAPLLLNKMSLHRDLHGDVAIFEKTLDLFQTGKFTRLPSKEEDKAACADIIQFLLLSTEKQQYEKAKEATNYLLGCKQELLSTLDPNLRNQLNREYVQVANDIFVLLKAGSNHNRYSEKSKETLPQPWLKESIMRKRLVVEYRSEVILRSDQIDTIIQCVQHKVAQMMMGGGKTSYILPIVMMVLSELKTMPITLMTRELFNMHGPLLNKTTRTFCGQPGFTFDIDFNETNSMAIAEKLDRLLSVKLDGGYLVMIREHLSAIENRLTRIADEISTKTAALFIDPAATFPTLKKETLPILLEEILELSQQRALLSHMRDIIRNHSTTIADEGDYTFDACQEDNASHGLSRMPDPSITEATGNIYTVILDRDLWDVTPVVEGKEEKESKEALERETKRLEERSSKRYKTTALGREEREALEALRNTILKGNTASLDEQTMQTAMKAAARILYRHYIIGKEKLFAISEEEWLAYVEKKKDSSDDIPKDGKEKEEKASGESSKVRKIPSGVPKTGSQRNRVFAYRYILAQVFPKVHARSLGIDMGLRHKDGCVVVPRSQKIERKNNEFGDEYVRIVSQFWQFIAKGSSKEFLELCVKKMSLSEEDLFEKIAKTAKSQELPNMVHFLQQPEAWNYRLSICRIFVIEAGKINIASRQITLSSHHMINPEACTILSGTINPYSLPRPFVKRFDGESSKSVEARTYLLMMASPIQKVKVIEDDKEIEAMASVLGDLSVKAIINPGLSLDGQDTLAIIKKLRESSLNPGRHFVFVHPDPDIRKLYIWMAGATHPVEYHMSNLTLSERRSCFFYFDPADARGTDVKILPGKVILLPGATTKQVDLVQAALRARLIGIDHDLWIWTLASHAKRICKQQGVSIDNIRIPHIINDTKKKTLETEGMKNFKTILLDVQNHLFTGLREIMAEDRPETHHNDYWEMGRNTLEPFAGEIRKIIRKKDGGDVAQEILDLLIKSKVEVRTDCLIDIVFDSLLFKIIEDLMILDKSAQFFPDPEYDMPTLKKIEALYKLEKEKLEKIKGELYRISGRIQGLMMFVSTSLRQWKKEINWQIHNQARIDKRVRFMTEVLQDIERKLGDGQKELIAQRETLLTYLPPKVDSQESGAAGTTVTMMQMVQQVNVTVQEAQVKKIPKRQKLESRYYPNVEFNKEMEKVVNPYGSNYYRIDDRLKYSWPRNVPEIAVTEEAAKLMEMVPTYAKFPFLRVAVFEFDDGTTRICLIGTNDLAYGLQRSKVEEMAAKRSLPATSSTAMTSTPTTLITLPASITSPPLITPTTLVKPGKKKRVKVVLSTTPIPPIVPTPTKAIKSIAVYSLDLSCIRKESAVGLVLAKQVYGPLLSPEVWPEELVVKCAFARLILGAERITDKEKIALRNWIRGNSGMPLKDFSSLCLKKCPDSTRKLFDELYEEAMPVSSSTSLSSTPASSSSTMTQGQAKKVLAGWGRLFGFSS